MRIKIDIDGILIDIGRWQLDIEKSFFKYNKSAVNKMDSPEMKKEGEKLIKVFKH